MTATLTDICVNLANASFSHDRKAVLARARQAGVAHCVLTGSCRESNKEVLAICRGFDDEFPGMLYATAGIHPHHAESFSTETLDELKQLAREDAVVAIGETGLDFNRNYSSRQAQEKAFEAQLALAADIQMPLFMHERDAHQRHYELLRNYRDSLVDGVIHCFTGTREALFNYLDMDLYIGITGWICDERRGTTLQALVANIPLDRLLLETDAPYLLPRSIEPRPKTRRNEPAWLPWVLQQVATCREETTEEIARQTTENARRFFRLK